ncbi:MAG TPA: ATP synthase F1 subunit delta [bacterium]|nr:ATP synthase F1 subunit delta [bacterium]HOL95391.1 ATP synthase F1 subunit delta [bacterium]HPO99602.1 ATP synthase F1 subunit delta [bacterium]
MQPDPIVASNYARALLNTTKQSGVPLLAARDEALQLLRLLESEPKFHLFLVGPQFRTEDKEKLVQTAFGNQLSRELFQFLLLVLRKNRIDELPGMLRKFAELCELDENITPGRVTTSIPLTGDEKRIIQEKLEAFSRLRFNLEFKVDPSLIAGLRVQYKDILIDTSLRTYLNEIRQRLLDTRLAS